MAERRPAGGREPTSEDERFRGHSDRHSTESQPRPAPPRSPRGPESGAEPPERPQHGYRGPRAGRDRRSQETDDRRRSRNRPANVFVRQRGRPERHRARLEPQKRISSPPGGQTPESRVRAGLAPPKAPRNAVYHFHGDRPLGASSGPYRQGVPWTPGLGPPRGEHPVRGHRGRAAVPAGMGDAVPPTPRGQGHRTDKQRSDGAPDPTGRPAGRWEEASQCACRPVAPGGRDADPAHPGFSALCHLGSPPQPRGLAPSCAPAPTGKAVATALSAEPLPTASPNAPVCPCVCPRDPEYPPPNTPHAIRVAPPGPATPAVGPKVTPTGPTCPPPQTPPHRLPSLPAWPTQPLRDPVSLLRSRLLPFPGTRKLRSEEPGPGAPGGTDLVAEAARALVPGDCGVCMRTPEVGPLWELGARSGLELGQARCPASSRRHCDHELDATRTPAKDG
ncbi:collagen alpha-1(I) chain-like [Meles meles]|uniref:collagen alpha-1(I) chain-like n=1 Tax=Meles meles TaxID=9662 RepID=UPI001E69B717|nr:collagen alpha-1(I) chain-like [Meles meles]